MPALSWIGKESVEKHHLEVPYRLLGYDESLSAGDQESGNLLVQGDNLNALKARLPYYSGKMKFIYIVPPYNICNERWQYNNNDYTLTFCCHFKRHRITTVTEYRQRQI